MSPGGSQPCCGRRGLLILAHLPNLITTSLLAEVAHLQQDNLVLTECHCGQWETSFGLSLGPWLQPCMSICGSTWTDALHAAHAQAACVLKLYQSEMGWSLCIDAGMHVGLRTCLTILVACPIVRSLTLAFTIVGSCWPGSGSVLRLDDFVLVYFALFYTTTDTSFGICQGYPGSSRISPVGLDRCNTLSHAM